MSCLTSFDLINGFSTDYMHCVCLGVSKALLSLWTTTSKCRNTQYDIRSSISIIDMHIKTIKIPSEIRRTPRGIKELKHWKGN